MLFRSVFKERLFEREVRIRFPELGGPSEASITFMLEMSKLCHRKARGPGQSHRESVEEVRLELGAPDPRAGGHSRMYSVGPAQGHPLRTRTTGLLQFPGLTTD